MSILAVDSNGRTVPQQKPGRSKQDYETPPEFMGAVVQRFGALAWDLAATDLNTQCVGFYGAAEDALQQNWTRCYLEQGRRGFMWLNPPFADLDPWASKCAEEMQNGCCILLLTPASVGSEWFHAHVRENAHVIELRPRMTFVGAPDPYPKDLILSVFCCGLTGRSGWRWKP